MQRAYQAPAPRRPSAPVIAKPIQSTKVLTWAVVGSGIVVFLFGSMVLAVAAGAMVLYASQRILPGVSVAGIPLGTFTVDEAATALEAGWGQITIRDGDRSWRVPPSQLGLTFDAYATALAAEEQGRGEGSFLAALVGQETVAPVLTVDAAAAAKGIKALADTVNLPAQNATIQVVNGDLAPVPAVEGRSLDVTATVNRLVSAPGDVMADGALDLVMTPTSPTVTDASALLQQARNLLTSPLTISAFDAITNQTITWSIPVDQWSQWLTTQNNPGGGITLTLDRAGLAGFIGAQNKSLPDIRYVDVDKSVAAVQSAISAGRATVTVSIYHKPTTYTVAPGDTLGTLSWKFGIPMFRLTDANRGIDMNSLSVGQTITIPSKDDLLPLPIVYNKRIVVSISKQRVRVFENGQLKWDWPASTGIPDSPTLPGVFQIQSHETNAYAGNWNLWMPYFMGIYDAVPGFTNGFHGFPTRNGYGILWESSLGHPVTYGCILISTQNAAALYNWAENGVVVEIQR